MELTIADTTIGGEILRTIHIAIDNERTTLRELIEARVRGEVEEYNKKCEGLFRGLVQPTESESTLNGYKLKRKQSRLDAEEQVYVALNAFTKNGYFVIVDNVQVDDLDQELLVGQHTSISFIKLTPLVGG